MEKLDLDAIRFPTLVLAVALGLSGPALAGDVSVRLDTGSGFSVQNETGLIERFRVDESTGDISRNGFLFLHTPGTTNLFVGAEAGSAMTPGLGYNAAFGQSALFSNTSGAFNTAFGAHALVFNTTGDRNLALGAEAGQNLISGSDNLYLMSPGETTESGRIRIGTPGAQVAAFIAGIRGSQVGTGALAVVIDANGQLGTGSPGQTLWSGDVDAAEHDFVNFAHLRSSPTLGGQSGRSLLFPNENGHGFGLASKESEQSSWAGVSRNTTANIGMNINLEGTNLGNFFNPGLLTSYEHNFDLGGWPTDVLSEYHWVTVSGVGNSTVANAGSFAVNDVISVEEPGNGGVVAVGFVKSIGAGPGAPISIDWSYTEAPDTNPPANGDTIEGTSSTTVTNRTGTFAMGDAVWICPVACETDGSNSTALIALTAIANQTGTTADLTWIRTHGPGSAVIPGGFLRQNKSGATANLGAVVVSKATTFASAIASTQDPFRGMSAVFYPHLQRANIAFHSNQATFDSGAATLRIGGGSVQDVHWFSIASVVDYDPGADVIGMVGDPVHQRNLGIHGKWKFFEAGSYAWGRRIEVGAPTTITALRTQSLADASGTIPVLDLAGCDPGDPIVLADAKGRLMCGEPGGGGALTFASASAPDASTSTAKMGTGTALRSPAPAVTLNSVMPSPAPAASPPLLATLAAGGNPFPTPRAGASPPPTCTAGEIFVDTDQADDTNCKTKHDNALCVCAATDHWVSNQ